MPSRVTINQSFNNILIIKPGAIGDLLQLSPVIRALRNKYPTARITVMVGTKLSADLFRYHPDVAEVLLFERHGVHRSWRALLQLWQTLHGKRYDLVLNFQRSNLKTWLLASASFPCKVLVYNKSSSRNVHAVVNYLETLTGIGIKPSDAKQQLELYLSEESIKFAHDLFCSNGFAGKPVIALNPGASHPVNRWSTAQFAALTDMIRNELNAAVIIVGGNDDTTLAQEIAAQTVSQPLIFTGRTSILQLGALLKESDLLVSGDTGPMHMATAVGTPVVALFGAADPARTGPVGSGHRVLQAHDVECVPCRSRKCSNNNYLECMERITVDEVFKAIKSMLEQGNRCVS